MDKNQETVKVAIRCRPLNEMEKQNGMKEIINVDRSLNEIEVVDANYPLKGPGRIFTFDHVYDTSAGQYEIFNDIAKPIVDAVINGYNGTIFAYGQTGTGKSYTMEGEESDENKGIIPNTFEYLFEKISKQSGNKDFLVRVSYLEIYNEEVRDLLSKRQEKLMIKESTERGIYVKDLIQFVVKGVSEISNILKAGKKNRSVGATMMNQDSSRSHSIFTILVECRETISNNSNNSEEFIRVGKLNLVDLAGSEKQAKTKATGERMKEGININLSLTALGNVVSALVDENSKHIPYRDSKLTRLLQDSLGGNTKTVMIANIGPADWNQGETLSTLRYANRAKNIKNKPKINEDPKDAMLHQYQDEIDKLKAELRKRESEKQQVQKKGNNEEEIENILSKMKSDMKIQLQRALDDEARAKIRHDIEEEANRQIQILVEERQKEDEHRIQNIRKLGEQERYVREYQERIEKERREHEHLIHKIRAMESKVLHGGVNLLDVVEDLDERSRAARKQLKLKKCRGDEKKKEIQELNSKNEDKNQQYFLLEQKAEAVGRKLEMSISRYKAKRSEIVDLKCDWEKESKELIYDIETLSRELKLKDSVITSFIPVTYQKKIEDHSFYNEEEESWKIDFIENAGNNMRAQYRNINGIDPLKELGHEIFKGASESLSNVYFSYDDIRHIKHVDEGMNNIGGGVGVGVESIGELHRYSRKRRN